MRFKKTKISGLYLIDLEPVRDQRGFFARSFCKQEFEDHGFDVNIVQCSISYNIKRGTLRGMHYQIPPFEEAKIVSCVRGSIYDVVLDLREESPTYCQWIAATISQQNHQHIFIPEGCAHGFQTLEDDSEVLYYMTEFYHPEYSRGIRWDDPVFSIKWPIINPTMSEKDKNYRDFEI